MSRFKNLPTRLKRRVVIEQPVDAADAQGGFTRSWQTLASVWAELLPLSGREALTDERLNASATYRVVMRYRADVDASKRLKFGARIFNIRSVIVPEEAKRTLELLVEEGVAT